MSHSDDLTAPLLSPPPPTPTIITTTVSDDPPISYTHSPRPLRDLPFLLLFLLLSLSSLSLGILSIARHNPNHSPSSFSFHSNSSSCLPSNSNSNSILSYSSSSSLQIVNNEHLIFALLITALLCPLLALSLLFLLRRFARHLIYSSLPLFILAPSFLNIYWFVSCTLSDSCSDSFPLPYRILLLIFIFILIALILWIIIANWHRIELTIHIIQIAATALEQNLGLFIALPVINFGVLVYLVPLVVFLVFARWNGKVVAREKGGGGWECVWRQEKWVGAYFGLVIVTMIWTVAAMVEAQVYVISGTIAQWYFAVEEEEGKKKPKRSIRSSMRNAFGPSFGTVCFSGMVMGAIRVVRAIVDSAQHEENAQGFVNLILKCCADVLLSAFDFVNKFTINFAAITGEAYCSSARMSYELLKRNLLSAVFVETVSTRVLAGIIFVLSTLYAIAVYAILNAVSHLEVEVYIIAALAWLLLILVLGYFVHVLDNVIDTIYVCYAIDRDKGEVCKQEVHEVYVMLPISRKNRPSLVDRTPLIV